MFVSSLASQRASDVRPTPTTSTHTHQPAGHHIHSFSDWDSNFELHNSTRQGQMGRCKGRNHLTRRRLPWLASMPLLFARRSQPRRPHTTRSWEHIESYISQKQILYWVYMHAHEPMGRNSTLLQPSRKTDTSYSWTRRGKKESLREGGSKKITRSP